MFPPFPPSLHQVSALQGVGASIVRTPAKRAIVDGPFMLTYGELGAVLRGGAVPQAPEAAATVLGWLAAAASRPYGVGEDETFVSCPEPLSHRALVLRLLNIAVAHPVFSRDTVSAVPLALTQSVGVTAAIAPLWLGGTLHLFRPGDVSGVSLAIMGGQVNQAWLGGPEFGVLEHQALTHPPHADFRGAVCVGLPGAAATARLRAWLGQDRVSALVGDDALGPVARHAGLNAEGEFYPGVMEDAAGRLSSLAAEPGLPVWREVGHAG